MAMGTISLVSANDSNTTDTLAIEHNTSEIAVDNNANEVIMNDEDSSNVYIGDSSNSYDSIITVTESGTHANDKVFKAKFKY